VLVGTQHLFPNYPDGRNGWNRDFVWAPSIVEHRGVYYMFYTGVRQRPYRTTCVGQTYQQIGVAVSTDLFQWNLMPDPWLTPAKVPWALQDTCAYNYGNFRDPFVMQDPTTGEWLMYYVTIPNAQAVAANVTCNGICTSCAYTDVRYAVGIAHAPSDFDAGNDWTDLRAMWNTYQTWPLSGCYRTWESPHVFQHTRNGQRTWYLFATAGMNMYGSDVVFATSTVSPSAPPSNWSFRGLLQSQNVKDPYGNALSTTAWYATEYFRDPDDGREYFANCASGPIEIRQILWRTINDRFDLVEPFHLTTLTADRLNVVAGTTIQLAFEGRNCVDPVGPRSVAIRAVTVDDQGNPIRVIPAAEIGLPTSVTLTGDRTVIPWLAEAWPPDSVTRLRIQLADLSSGISTLPITVVANGSQQPIEVTDVPETPPSRQEPSLRALGATPLGAGFGLLVELPEPMRARLDVFDLRGRVVRRLANRDLPAGATVERWDLRDEDGRRVPPGVYYARLVTPRGMRSARLVTLSPR
jgi:hypothetical protein